MTASLMNLDLQQMFSRLRHF